jgi:hypothetical protein
LLGRNVYVDPGTEREDPINVAEYALPWPSSPPVVKEVLSVYMPYAFAVVPNGTGVTTEESIVMAATITFEFAGSVRLVTVLFGIRGRV